MRTEGTGKRVALRMLPTLALALCFAAGLVGCGDGASAGSGGGSTVAGAEAGSAASAWDDAADSAAAADEMAVALSALDGVKDVQRIDGDFQFFTSKYLVTFEQPLDWEDPSAGSFLQRVEVGLVATPAANVLGAEGYLIPEKDLATDDAPDLVRTIQGNYVRVEHRFFGGSLPAGLSNDEVEGWQYLTASNAAADLHKVYQELSKVLEGPWAATGASRGGQVCNSYAYYYPDDMAFCVSYVAPCSSGPEDNRMCPWVYTGIGDDKYGAEQAAAYRKLVSDFQVACMSRKAELAPRIRSSAAAEAEAEGKPAPTYRAAVTDDRLFDLVVAEFAVQAWQYDQDFASMERVLALPEGTPEEQQAKTQAILDQLVVTSSPRNFSTSGEIWPYYVGASAEYGQYRYDLSFLREACSEAGLGDVVSITPDEEESIVYDLVLTPEQKEAFAYDGTLSRELEAWADTTEGNVIMIYGASDPWYAMRIHDTENPHVHSFVDRQQAHTASIATLEEGDREQVMSLLREWLGMGGVDRS